MAELGEIGFDSFEETEHGLAAYIAHENYNEANVHEIFDRYKSTTNIDFSSQFIEKENWNELWEENYDPIEVEGRCRVRATFHEPQNQFPIEIVINPKMSFGTGHHATTWQMIKLMLDLDLEGKVVADLGCGTGILAVLAAIKGATQIEATDVDDWCVENSIENFRLNGCEHIGIQKGSIEVVKFDQLFDVVLANINKNVLLHEMHHYANMLKPNGQLLLSGFYHHDVEDITHKAGKYNLSLESNIQKNDWAALMLVKMNL